MKVYLDDMREPYTGWVLVKTVPECIELLKTGEVKELSLDHDLGTDPVTGYDVLLWLEEQVHIYNDKSKVPDFIFLHTQNPIGKARMKQSLEKILGKPQDHIVIPDYHIIDISPTVKPQ